MPDYEKLNDAQRKAVTRGEGPLLLLAGPGSGKTFTIVQRILYLLEQGIAPEKILVITFTREAAASMQQRFRESKKEFCPVNFGTFHSVFYFILKESKVFRSQKLLTNSEKIRFMIRILKKRKSAMGETAGYTDYREDAVSVLSAVSYFKNTGNRQESLRKVPLEYQQSFWEIYEEYARQVKTEEVLDFDDMLFECKRLLEEHPAIRERWQKRFSHILIDEFQDINPIQYEIIKLLSPPPYNIFAVGDDDQSIYGFRGSAPRCLKQFEEEFHAQRLLLNINYRSTEEIVRRSLKIMEGSKERFAKELKSGRGRNDDRITKKEIHKGLIMKGGLYKEEGVRGETVKREAAKGEAAKREAGAEAYEETGVRLRAFPGREQEQMYLVERLRFLCCSTMQETTEAVDMTVQGAVEKAVQEAQTVAVLFRTNIAMQSFAALLRKAGIPYTMKEQGKSIYEHFVVQDIMAYLSLSEGTGSREDLLRIVNKPGRFISRETAAREGLDSEHTEMEKLRRQLFFMKTLPLKATITYLLKAVGYEKHLKELAAGKPEKWQEWQEVLAFVKTDTEGYESLSEWREAQRLYGEATREVKRLYEQAQDVGRQYNAECSATESREQRLQGKSVPVQLMTVHASKGLEFDTVFIPDCNEGVYPYGRNVEEKQAEEERRILYVGMTRAKNSLELMYLTGTEKSPRLPSRFLNPILYSSSTNSSNSQLSRYSSNASATFSYSSSSSI